MQASAWDYSLHYHLCTPKVSRTCHPANCYQPARTQATHARSLSSKSQELTLKSHLFTSMTAKNLQMTLKHLSSSHKRVARSLRLVHRVLWSNQLSAGSFTDDLCFRCFKYCILLGFRKAVTSSAACSALHAALCMLRFACSPLHAALCMPRFASRALHAALCHDITARICRPVLPAAWP